MAVLKSVQQSVNEENRTYVFHYVQVQFSRSHISTLVLQLIFQFENPNYIIKLKLLMLFTVFLIHTHIYTQIHAHLSNYRQVCIM